MFWFLQAFCYPLMCSFAFCQIICPINASEKLLLVLYHTPHVLWFILTWGDIPFTNVRKLCTQHSHLNQIHITEVNLKCTMALHIECHCKTQQFKSQKSNSTQNIHLLLLDSLLQHDTPISSGYSRTTRMRCSNIWRSCATSLSKTAGHKRTQFPCCKTKTVKLIKYHCVADCKLSQFVAINWIAKKQRKTCFSFSVCLTV